MAAQDSTLTAKQAEAIALLGAGLPVHEVAEKLGVSRGSLWNWSKVPGFQEAIAAVKAARVAELDARITELAASALATMEELSQAADKDSVRFSAAKYLLDRMLGSPTQTVAAKSADAASFTWWAQASASEEEEGE